MRIGGNDAGCNDRGECGNGQNDIVADPKADGGQDLPKGDMMMRVRRTQRFLMQHTGRILSDKVSARGAKNRTCLLYNRKENLSRAFCKFVKEKGNPNRGTAKTLRGTPY